MGWFGKRQRPEAEVSLERLQAGTPAPTTGHTPGDGSPGGSRFAGPSTFRAGLTPEAAEQETARIAAEGSEAAFGMALEMTVDDVVTITGRGTVATGAITNGMVAEGMAVVVTTSGGPIETTVAGIESAEKQVPAASIGDRVGLLLAGVGPGQVAPGDTIAG